MLAVGRKKIRYKISPKEESKLLRGEREESAIGKCAKDNNCLYSPVNDRVWDKFCDTMPRTIPVASLVVTKFGLFVYLSVFSTCSWMRIWMG